MRTLFAKSQTYPKLLVGIALLSAFMLCFSCVSGEDEGPSGKVEANLRTLSLEENSLSEANTQFAINLFQQIATNGEAENIFFSPYSVHQALAMAMNGNDGEVLEEFIQVLQMEGMSLEEANQAVKDLTTFLLEVDPKVELGIANGIWYKEGYEVQIPFKNSSQQYFNAEIAALNMRDPKAVDVINHWIERQTNELIREMLDAIPADAVMYLVNAIYFKGDWAYNFPEGNTQKEKFTLRNGEEIMADMMNLGEPAAFKGYDNSDYTYLEIPYSTGQYTMGVLTNESGDLSQLYPYLTMDKLNEWRNNTRDVNLILKMPKFKIDYKINNLGDDLKAMGLVTPFDFHPDNFTQLFSNSTDLLKISRVIHQALIEVDEKGTEAAAATIIEIGVTSLPPDNTPTVFTLDRPFIFFIQEKHSGAILFMGKMENPLES
ncbi:serpin family protein [Algoriphagus halophytocola]|uniref:Serpin family protein n=1 Tax=Algoriphagus halophytocola TaxID=2991499 RepID=A0ABY6MCB6_9BACT|nr:serpin family protein [Algoriphagus sp. TR-M5]UZD21093.1 serpin family protein [Algoriphagus sp. TR-M5]